MNTPRVTLAPHLLQQLDFQHQPHSCTNTEKRATRRSGTPENHRHSGIGWHTASSVHFGAAQAIDEARQQTLTAAYHINPARFGRRPRPPARPDQAWINEPQDQARMNRTPRVSLDLTNTADPNSGGPGAQDLSVARRRSHLRWVTLVLLWALARIIFAAADAMGYSTGFFRAPVGADVDGFTEDDVTDGVSCQFEPPLWVGETVGFLQYVGQLGVAEARQNRAGLQRFELVLEQASELCSILCGETARAQARGGWRRTLVPGQK